MNDRLTHARGRVLKADSDLFAARRMLDTNGPFDTTCFHAQQAAEKLLKALLAFFEKPIPRTHNLEELQQLCLACVRSPELATLDLAELTAYAVQMRYDFEFWPDKPTAEAALQTAESVRTIVVGILPPGAEDEFNRTQSPRG